MSTGEFSEAMVLNMVRKKISLALSLSILLSAGFFAQAQAAAPPRKSMVLFNQANSLSGRNKFKEAIEKYKEAIQLEPGNAFFYHMYGLTLAHMGLLQDAVTQYKQSMSLTSNPSAALYNDLGVALANLGDYAESACNLKKAVTINPKFIAAYNNLGVALENLGDYKQAREVFKTSLKLQPTNKVIEIRHQKVSTKVGESKPFDYKSAEVGAGAGGTTQATTADSGMPTDGDMTRAVVPPTKDATNVETSSPTGTVPSTASAPSVPSGVAPPVSAVTPAAKRKFDEQTRPGGSSVDPGTLGISTTITPTKSSSGTETTTTTIKTTTTTVPESQVHPLGTGTPTALPAASTAASTDAQQQEADETAPNTVPADQSKQVSSSETKSDSAEDKSPEVKPHAPGEVRYAPGAKNVPTTDDTEEEEEQPKK
jgi:tetratricopeptide (TPR) repeat protein